MVGSAVLEHVRACVAGDAEARRAFQDRFAEDVYNYPVKIYGLPAEQAADFYLYVFENDRIFSRLRSFEGRNAIQLRTFLAYYVLRSLFFEWQRGRHELDTVPLGDEEPAGAGTEPAPAPGPEGLAAEVWAGLSPQEQLDLKLLSLLERDLTPADLALLARLSGRTLRDTADAVAEVLQALRARDVQQTDLRDRLDAVWGWIVLRRRELQEIDEKMRLMGPEQHGPLLARRQRVEEALARRVRQRDRILEEMRRLKLTTPYKDIARLLGTSVGTVCSRIARLRKRLADRWAWGEDDES